MSQEQEFDDYVRAQEARKELEVQRDRRAAARFLGVDPSALDKVRKLLELAAAAKTAEVGTHSVVARMQAQDYLAYHFMGRP